MSSAGPARRALGDRLRRLRERANYSHSDVSRMLDLVPGETVLWESGRTDMERSDVERLLELYEASPVECDGILRLYDQRMSGGVFISYRRADEAAFAGRLYDKIAASVGEHRTFMDVDSITLGVDFVQMLDSTLDSCMAMIVVIGSEWLNARDDQGKRRLDDPQDYVRLEIEKGLARDIFVIPILVDGVRMPRPEELPAPLASLSRRNGHAMSNARFGADSLQLLGTIEQILRGSGVRASRTGAE